MASVRKRRWVHNGAPKEAWVVEFTDLGGKRRRKTFDLKRDAEKHRSVVERDLESGEYTADRETITLGEAIGAWLKDCEMRHKIDDDMSGNTLHGYRTKAAIAVRGLGGVPLNKLRRTAVQDFINKLAEKGARSSCSAVRTVILQSLRLAIRRGFLRRNVLAEDPIKIPRGAAVKEIVPPSRADIDTLLRSLAIRRPYEQELPRQNRITTVMLAIFGGLRRGEIVGLQWENVDFANRTLNIEHSFSRFDGLKGTKTKAGRRRVPMGPFVLGALEMLAALPQTGVLAGPVLKNKFGKGLHLDHLGGYDWREIMRGAGLINSAGGVKYSMHTMRHAAVSLLIEQGLEPFRISKIIGHSKISTTMDVYGHLLPENRSARNAVSAIGQQFETPLALLPPAANKRPITEEEWASAKALAATLFDEGLQIADIAKRLSVSYHSVRNWLWGKGAGRDKMRQEDGNLLK